MGFFDSITDTISGAFSKVTDIHKKPFDMMSKGMGKLKFPGMDSMKGMMGGGGGGGGGGIGGGLNMSGMNIGMGMGGGGGGKMGFNMPNIGANMKLGDFGNVGANFDLQKMMGGAMNGGMSSALGGAMSGKFGGLNMPDMNFGASAGAGAGGMNLNGMLSGLDRLKSLGSFGSILSALGGLKFGASAGTGGVSAGASLGGFGISAEALSSMGDLSLPKYQKLAQIIVGAHGPEASAAWSVDPSQALSGVASSHPDFANKMATYLGAEKKYLDLHDNPPTTSADPKLELLDAKQRMMGEQAKILLEGQDAAAYAKTGGDPFKAMEVLESKYPKLYTKLVKYTETHVVPK